VSYPPRPTAPEPFFYQSFDGRMMAYRDVGTGRPTLLVHGIMSDGAWSWFGPGHVARLVATGRRAVVPDLRGHGRSEVLRDESAYAEDALARDAVALLEHLGIDDFDVVGYSLGARTAIRMLVRGARPGRVVLGGIGDALASGDGSVTAARLARIIATDGSGDDADDAATRAWLRHAGFDPHAMRALAAALVPTTVAELAAIATPAVVVMGRDDGGVGSPERLAALLGNASARRIPGDHVQAGLAPDFGEAIVEFLEADTAHPKIGSAAAAAR
jgi:pimeloyl-ACP methyl ester carboxylesterase